MNDRYRLRDLVIDEARLRRFYRFMDPTGLVVGGNISPNWMLDGTSFWYAHGAPRDTVILRVDGATGNVAPLLDVTRTRKALTELLGRESPGNGLPFESIVELGGGCYQFTFEGTEYALSRDDYVIGAVGRSATAHAGQSGSRDASTDVTKRMTPQFYRRPIWMLEPMLVTEAPSPDKRWFASLKDGNIVLRSPADDRTVPLTADGTPAFAWDIEAPRIKYTAGAGIEQHRLDPWSPDGHRLFAIKYDRRAVPEIPYIRYLKREEEVCSHKIQRAGGPMDIAHPHAIDVLAKRVQRFDLGDTENQYFTLIGWTPGGAEVIFTRHSRDFKTVDVLAGDPTDGSVRVVLSESTDTFIAIQHEVLFGGDNHVTLLPDGSGLVWRSARSGWHHLYLYALDGILVRALTGGDFPVIDVVAVDQGGGWLYFTAHHDQERPYDTHLCRVKLSGGAIQRLTQLDGQNVVSMSPSRQTFTVVNSRCDRPFRTDFFTQEGRHLTSVQKADVTALEAQGYVASEEFTVLAADGKTELWGIMHKPPDFDPRKKYPVIDHLYAAPVVAMVPHGFDLGRNSQSRLDRALTQLGYIVISVDARGTPERSKAFQDAVYRNWGRHEIADHVATLNQLGSRHGFIDLDRVGVWGHSWGGYFALRALAQAPDVFHVGVAAAPGSDVYDSIFYEPYLDLPTRSKAAYDYASNHEWLRRITGKLLMAVGTCDSYIYAHTIELTHHLIEAGVDHELVVLPEAFHSFSGKNDEYFIHKFVKHFELHLKARDRTTAATVTRRIPRRESIESD